MKASHNLHAVCEGINQSTIVLVLLFLGMMSMLLVEKAVASEIKPVLELPQIGLDDTTTYSGYTTRFYKDSQGNTLQISINENTGRLLNLWADGFNESIALSIRDGDGSPADVSWDSPGAKSFDKDGLRTVQYSVVSKNTELEIGHFQLGTMRLERDFTYFEHHLKPYDSKPFLDEGMLNLISTIRSLGEEEQRRHLNILKASTPDELTSRVMPQLSVQEKIPVTHFTAEKVLLDGKNRQVLHIAIDPENAEMALGEHSLTIKAKSSDPIKLHMSISSDAPSLTPLSRKDIFNEAFFKYYDEIKSRHDALLERFRGSEDELQEEADWITWQRLERQVAGMEVMCFEEKFFAGLPNYATYFGRDMIMSALMLEPVLRSEMLEHVISSVLTRLRHNGEVDHEEGLGEQAIRERSWAYTELLKEIAANRKAGKDVSTKFEKAEAILSELQKTTSNYHMVDDDFQLSVLTAAYFSRKDVSDEQIKRFLNSPLSGTEKPSRLILLLRNLNYVASLAKDYVVNPSVENLISFSWFEYDKRWHAGSWRDSRVGYANGRYAMDVNAIWVPAALSSMQMILKRIQSLGFKDEVIRKQIGELAFDGNEPTIANQPLAKAIRIWKDTDTYFRVQLTADEVKARIGKKLAWQPEDQRDYWQNILDKHSSEAISFLAVSLDQDGKAIPLINTDPATWLFLEDLTDKYAQNDAEAKLVFTELKDLAKPFPTGLYIEDVGLAVVNDAYATPDVWQGFVDDIYHAPVTVWGREVNLYFLGLAKQIEAAYTDDGQLKDDSLRPYVQSLFELLDRTNEAVLGSGLKYNELWSYKIEEGDLLPARYYNTSDMQLWNLTDIAVQFKLSQLPEKP